MKIETRVDITKFIVELEQKFDVDKWKVNGVDIWPPIRISIIFFLVRTYLAKTELSPIELANPIKKKANLKLQLNELIIQLKNFVKYKIWIQKLKEKRTLFFSNSINLSIFENKNIIRFIDPLVWKYSLENDSYIIDYGSYYNNEFFNENLRVDLNYGIQFYDSYKKYFLNLFSSSTNDNKINTAFQDFINYLNNLDPIFHHLENELKSIFKKDSYYSFYNTFFYDILKKIKPKSLVIMVYYENHLNFAITYMANKLKIKTIEMQHGPQTENQTAYGNFTKIPFQGFNSMPKIYWCWDESSRSPINNWIVDKSKVNSILGGNPWIEYWKNKNIKSENCNYILYSLQPKPLELIQLFPDSIIQIINSNKFSWVLRSHPRQDKIELLNFLQEINILDKVSIEDSNHSPLPLSIYNCLFHVTNFSGTTIEAAIMKKKTVLLHNIGMLNCISLIEENLAIYLDPNNPDFEIDFYSFAEKILSDNNIVSNNIKINKLEEKIDHVFIKNMLLEG
jgi:hypothetical protein